MTDPNTMNPVLRQWLMIWAILVVCYAVGSFGVQYYAGPAFILRLEFWTYIVLIPALQAGVLRIARRWFREKKLR
jgi:hypothetical protein